MKSVRRYAMRIVYGTVLSCTGAVVGHAQQPPATMDSEMLMVNVGDLRLMAMAQAFPTFTFALPSPSNTPLERTGFYITQPTLMTNLSTARDRVVLRTTLNFEGITLLDGEITYGAWGEGFIDKRHPHTLIHELMLSWNSGTAWEGFSVSAGKGFAPYGTADPMSRPAVKYPTNHHLSQALERWLISGVGGFRSWGVEAGVFGGQEPEGPYDFSNISSFGNSWSGRITKRFGVAEMGSWPWELSTSYARITEKHEGHIRRSRLMNVAARHERKHGDAHVYALLEAARVKAEHADSYFSVLGETHVHVRRHIPYARIEYATRPEYERAGLPSTEQFFRYDHDAKPIGATRWLTVTAGFGYTLAGSPVSPRPYVEATYNRVRAERGGIDPDALYGRSTFWSISVGARIFVGGEPMRMGTYGVLDPMTSMHTMPEAAAGGAHKH